MALTAEPVAQLSHLPKADGSATFSCCGFTVTAAVNGPVEAPRRDENAFEALVDVVVRPAAGVGGTAERQLESLLQPTLRQLIPVRNFPRCMIQITLQVMEMPENAYVNAKILQAQLNLAIIPGLIHAAILGLLTAAVPLKTIATAVTLAIGPDDAAGIVVDPTMVQVDNAKSVHVLGFTADDELLLAESSGSFSTVEWDQVLETGQRACCQGRSSGQDTVMTDGMAGSASIRRFIRSVMETKTAADLYWK
ncbi:exosome non-catalytic core subunit rrp46 [Purpureocillium takamizusanense]|uniref:Exosome non-catalytic core subunit rrp46 n=1 Tax=Purpureocillium takamizusanense TaxID=2060973 RepID=A0A9Q8QLL9_9HYPO|nr:exosome non-catalytic core subunit rrp46 [Purpureocillium takamizusanense]UNI20999.1 exosome non-catalytic core subunit rrp46 [Purpureocillium takamizusanense]